MPVVSNTSPVSNLAIIDRLGLLCEQLGVILIPPAVHAELLRLPVPAALARVNAALADGRLRITPLAGRVPDHLKALDHGEAEALTLALEIHASRVVLDESIARQHAVRLGLPHVGVLGILRHAKQTGRIPSLADEVAKLRSEAHFYVSLGLEKRLLASVDE